MVGIEEDKYTVLPTLGQHNIEVLRGILGYSEEKISRLREEEEKHWEELELRLRKIRGDPAARLLEQKVERKGRRSG